jgi:hypothetical protein
LAMAADALVGDCVSDASPPNIYRSRRIGRDRDCAARNDRRPAGDRLTRRCRVDRLVAGTVRFAGRAPYQDRVCAVFSRRQGGAQRMRQRRVSRRAERKSRPAWLARFQVTPSSTAPGGPWRMTR